MCQIEPSLVWIASSGRCSGEDRVLEGDDAADQVDALGVDEPRDLPRLVVRPAAPVAPGERRPPTARSRRLPFSSLTSSSTVFRPVSARYCCSFRAATRGHRHMDAADLLGTGVRAGARRRGRRHRGQRNARACCRCRRGARRPKSPGRRARRARRVPRQPARQHLATPCCRGARGRTSGEVVSEAIVTRIRIVAALDRPVVLSDRTIARCSRKAASRSTPTTLAAPAVERRRARRPLLPGLPQQPLPVHRRQASRRRS